MTDPELKKFKRNLSTAQREMRKAVERAGDTDLRRGHYMEAHRLAQACVDAANELIRTIEERS